MNTLILLLAHTGSRFVRLGEQCCRAARFFHRYRQGMAEPMARD